MWMTASRRGKAPAPAEEPPTPELEIEIKLDGQIVKLEEELPPGDTDEEQPSGSASCFGISLDRLNELNTVSCASAYLPSSG